MDDNAPPDEKDRLGLTAMILRRSKNFLQPQVAERLGVTPHRVSEIESDGASPERIQDLAKRIDFRTVHVLKTLDLLDFLAEEGRRPFDPLGPTPEQEVAIYKAGRDAVARLSADPEVWHGRSSKGGGWRP